MKKFKANIEELGFELELSDKWTDFDYSNTAKIEIFIDKIEEDEKCQSELENNEAARTALESLKQEIEDFKKIEVNLSKEDLKKVYIMLKERELHPKGSFDKAGRFYLDDSELVDVRPPSAAYPYSQMKAGRTSAFVKKMADKYKATNLNELIALFVKNK